MPNKKILGQFFTTNSSYILQNLEPYIYNKNIVDPFCGNQDLMHWAKVNGAKSTIGYDIDHQYINNVTTLYNDTLKNPIHSDFILTNPPYLYFNKIPLTHKSLFTNSNLKDIYHLALHNLLSSNEGILILPINFLTSNSATHIRNLFFQKYIIKEANYFTHQMFTSTKNNIISFYYQLKSPKQKSHSFHLTIYPQKIITQINLKQKYSYLLGGKDLHKFSSTQNYYTIKKLTTESLLPGNIITKLAINNLNYTKNFYLNPQTKELINNNIIFLQAISKVSHNHTFLSDIRNYKIAGLLSNKNSRNQAHLLIEPTISINKQIQLITLVNQELNKLSQKYHNLIFVNYRDHNRKRLSFSLITKILNYYLTKI